MEEFERALKSRDCQKILEILDDYLEKIENEDELRAFLEKVETLILKCEGSDAYELAHEITHIYAHLGELDKGIEIYKKLVEKYKEEREKYLDALYHLADAYEHFGMPNKAIDVYEKLLELEKKIGNKREEALTLAHIAINYDELEEVDRAIELMNEASKMFKELGDERNYLVSILDLAHFHYEVGDYNRAEELILEVLKSPRDAEIEVNARIVDAEIKAAQENFKKAFSALRFSLLKALETEDLFTLAFEALYEFITGLFEEKLYKEIYENIESLAEPFEDTNPEYTKFFIAIGELAKLKEGQENRYEEVYTSIEVNEFKELLDELKKIGTTVLKIGF
ncbi:MULTISPECIES: lipopolysaccharide assembly protein LapB [Thermococcus]|nr:MULTISPECIES: tetratricopeptide repeat protein [Thermococcus]KUK16907.1 MAG: TRP-repeat-containing protein [Thermococcus sibiricus]KUK28843.1 MAG: TRP-repeat-containing protein [Thermococcus sp. 40_45]MBC7094180.1 tetratricopeptide repeat protein [Thermococcus sp.]HII66839.1 tetratricopeptide repeat protein [Thermococcaceae archaeon]